MKVFGGNHSIYDICNPAINWTIMMNKIPLDFGKEPLRRLWMTFSNGREWRAAIRN